jgi:septum formation protein
MNIILGSKSPRRQQLLRELGFTFTIRTSDTDESYPDSIPVEDVAQYIANKKSDELSNTLSPNELLICADTVVLLEDKLLGKPENRRHAIEMLELLSGRAHCVLTGVSLRTTTQKTEFCVCTNVFFHTLSKTFIEHYIDTYQPYDKAGSYGIQEWFGYVAVKRIEGSFTNVMGLPTHETYHSILKFSDFNRH